MVLLYARKVTEYSLKVYTVYRRKNCCGLFTMFGVATFVFILLFAYTYHSFTGLLLLLLVLAAAAAAAVLL